MKKRNLFTVPLSILLSTAMLMNAPAAFAQEADLTGAVVENTKTADTGTFTLNQAKIHSDKNGKTFLIEGSCTSGPVLDMDDACETVRSLSDQLDAGGRVHFEPWRDFTDTKGNHYYVFQQMYAGTTVSGGAVKVITDPDGNMLGIVSSVESELPDTEVQAEITAEDAEALVLQHALDTNQPEPGILKDHTKKTILPVNLELDPYSEEEKEESRFVWVVYSRNPEAGVAQSSGLPYLAHYVTTTGEYLYSLPTVIPGDEAGDSGFDASYVFEFMEPAEYTGTVTLSDGTQKEISITLMKDSRTGMYYLGNLERRIVVSDCYEFLYNNGNIVLEASKDNTGWDETCLLSLYNYCLAWDYYDQIGWTGGDGQKTPMVILKDFCDDKHEPVNNAAYAGNYYGWQAFLSSSANDYSQCLDVLAHEFTHCVTDSVMTYSPYKNDYGAINEAIGDIQGNLCQMMVNGTEDAEWLIGEESSQIVRSMSDPHQYAQPEYAWDLYYTPNVLEPTAVNDRGGVHSNSSLLNNIAFRLCTEGGMTLEEARSFWFAVDCTMVPGTDFAQLSVLMPWVLKNLDMEKYLPALESAMDHTRVKTDEMPGSFGEDRALVTMTLPDTELFRDGTWSLSIASVDPAEVMQNLKDIKDGNGEHKDALVDLGLTVAGYAVNKAGELLAEVPEEALAEMPAEVTEEASDVITKGPDANSALYHDLLAWVKTYFGDAFYSGQGAAGQDGRTVRMVCRPGFTIPVLTRLKMSPSSTEPESVAAAVYLFGSWIDLGGMAQALAESSENEDYDWIPVLTEMADSVSTSLMSLENLGYLTDLSKIWKLFLVEMEGGKTCSISAKGLEKITVLDGSIFSAGEPALSEEKA